MQDEDKTKEQLIAELKDLRQQIAEIKTLESESLFKAKSALAESEERYRAIGELIPFGVWVYSPDQGISYLSDSFLKMVGMTLSEYKKTGWAGLVSPERVQRMTSEWKHCVETNCFWDYEYGIKGRDGKIYTILSRGVPLQDKEGRITSWVGINLDITDRKRIEETLAERQRALTTLLSNLPGMVYRSRNDTNWNMEFVSHGSYPLTGYEPSDLLDSSKTSYSSLINPQDIETVRNEIRIALGENRPYRLVYRITTASGEEKWVMEQGRGVFSNEGELLALEGFITDITERRAAEDALKESERKYRALVESSSNAILMVDKERRIVSFNRAFLDLFGFESEEVEGRSTRLLHPSEESFRNFTSEAYGAADAHGSFMTEWNLMKKDGTLFPIEETLSVVRDDTGSIKAYVAIIRDISKRKKAQEELAHYRDRLEEMVMERTKELEEAHKALLQKEKLKTLGAISAEVAHEIRNPLMSIGGFARRLQKKFPYATEVDIILAESRRLEKILDRIRNYLKPVEMRQQECYVNVIISETLAFLNPELEREGISIQLDLKPDMPAAYADPGILTQVFINVIRSAMRVMDKKQSLVIRTHETDQSIQVHLESLIQGQRKISHTETPFIPMDEHGGNVSVPLCARLLQDMGGVLSFSQEKNYMTFTISLPKAFQPGMAIDGAEI